MLPRYLVRTECGEKRYFPIEDRAYYLGDEESPTVIHDSNLIKMLLDPIWSWKCNQPSWVEVIPTIDQLEKVYGLVKSNKAIDFPFCNKFISKKIRCCI